MVDQYVFGWIFVSVLSLLALYSLIMKKNSSSTRKSECVEIAKALNGDCGSKNDDVDVIIVGAGVAGSALAYTLGKVNCYADCLFLHFLTSRLITFSCIFFLSVQCNVLVETLDSYEIMLNIYCAMKFMFEFHSL